MARASLLVRGRETYEDGAFAEIRIWHVATPVLPSRHRYKYSLAYVVNGNRLIGYDNERGKGDHRHFGEREELYQFVSLDRLLEDFWKDMRRIRSIT